MGERLVGRRGDVASIYSLIFAYDTVRTYRDVIFLNDWMIFHPLKLNLG